MRYVTDQGGGGVLPLTQDVKKQLTKKHPAGVTAQKSALRMGDIPSVTTSIFDCLRGDLIKKCALRTQGSRGV